MFSRASRYVSILFGLVLLLTACIPNTASSQPAAPPTLVPEEISGAITAPTAAELFGPTETPQPTSTPPVDSFCVQGSWEVSDLAGSIAAHNQGQGSSMGIDKVSGQAIYRFTPLGDVDILFNGVEIDMSGRIDGKDTSASDRMQGSATAKYQIDEYKKILTMTDFGGVGIDFNIVIDGQILAEGNFPAWQAFSTILTNNHQGPTAPAQTSHASITCNVYELTVQLLDPIPGPLVKMHRLE